MNQELLTRIKELKNNGAGDDDVVRQLSQSYPIDSISESLSILKDMQAVNVQPPSPKPLERAVKFNTFKKYRRLIILFSLFLIMWLIIPFTLQVFSKSKASSIDEKLIQEFGVERSYHAGSTKECVNRQPSSIGDVTELNACSLITAKVYYPKILEKELEYGVYENGVYDSSELVYKTQKRIDYVDENGEKLQHSVLTIYPTSEKGIEFYDYLKLGGHQYLSTTGLTGEVSLSSETDLKGWEWNSRSSIGLDTPGAILLNSITKKILADESPAKDAPTASEAFSQDRAPLVVVSVLRYCHSPSIVLLDKMCILPQ